MLHPSPRGDQVLIQQLEADEFVTLRSSAIYGRVDVSGDANDHRSTIKRKETFVTRSLVHTPESSSGSENSTRKRKRSAKQEESIEKKSEKVEEGKVLTKKRSRTGLSFNVATTPINHQPEEAPPLQPIPNPEADHELRMIDFGCCCIFNNSSNSFMAREVVGRVRCIVGV